MKYSLSFLAVLALSMPAMAADTQVLLEGFDAVTPYDGNAAVWASPALQDTAVITSQAGVNGNALKMVYNYQGDPSCAYGGYHSWNHQISEFATPIDMSNCDGFTVKIKNTANTDMAVMFWVEDAYGQWMRLMDNNNLADARTDWTERTVAFSQAKADSTGFGQGLQTSMWAADGQGIDLSKIKKFGINVYDRVAVTANGSFTVELDDMYAFEGNDNRNAIVAFDFNTAGSMDGWVADSGATVVAGTAADGKATMNITQNVTQYVNRGAMKTLSAPVDFTKFSYALVEVEGDAAMVAANPTLDLNFVDSNGKIVTALAWKALAESGKATFYLPTNTSGFQDATYYGLSCWRFGTYAGDRDANADFNFASVSKIKIGFENQDAVTGSLSATIKVKKIVIGNSSNQPVPPLPVDAKTATAAKATTPIAIDGTGSDAQWAAAEWNGDFISKKDSSAIGENYASRFKLMYDTTNLYFLVEMTSKGDVRRYYAPNTDGNTLNQAYYNSAATAEEMWIDGFDFRISPTAPNAKFYQVLPYFTTDAAGKPLTGNAFLFGSNSSSWVQRGLDKLGAVVKSNVTTEKITVEGKCPFSLFDIATLNPSGAAVAPVPTEASVWYLQALRSCWTTADTSVTGASQSSKWFDAPGDLFGTELTFSNKAAVADWSQF